MYCTVKTMAAWSNYQIWRQVNIQKHDKLKSECKKTTNLLTVFLSHFNERTQVPFSEQIIIWMQEVP